MGGWPVWLASASLRDRHGAIIPTDRWPADVLARVQASLDTLLDGIGDPERERSFRMCVTLCRHRALTDDEHDRLPDAWHDEPAVDIAGGPVEVLWHHGVPDPLSARPCTNPGRERLSRTTWLPVDCGECGPCRARAAVAGGVCACRRASV